MRSSGSFPVYVCAEQKQCVGGGTLFLFLAQIKTKRHWGKATEIHSLFGSQKDDFFTELADEVQGYVMIQRSSNPAQKDECLQINQFNGLPLALNHYLSFCYNQFPNNLLKAQTPKLMVTEPPKLMSLKFYIFINLISKF